MRLDDILHQHDPAASAADVDVARLRTAVFEAKPQRSMRRAVTASILLLVIVTAVTLRRQTATAPHPTVIAAAPSVRPALRQLHMSAPHGTKLVWVFNDQLTIER